MSNPSDPWGSPPPTPGWSSTPPPGYQPPPAYGAPGGFGGFGGAPAREHPQGTTILVLGILSLVLCQILGPFAWVMGNKAIREIDASPGSYTNRGSVNAGRICGIVSTVLMIASFGFVLLFVLIGIGSST